MFDIKNYNSEHVLTCVSYCGKIDRMIHKFRKEIPANEKSLRINAGFRNDLEPGSRDEMVAKGTLEWLIEFHKDPLSFSLSSTAVKVLHRRVFKYSSRDGGTRGHYRTDLDKTMKAIFETTKQDLGPYDRHPLFTISLFRISFIDAMPFVTGNLLCANLIAYALLCQNGFALVSQLPLLASLDSTDSNDSKDRLSILPKTIFKLISRAPESAHTADPEIRTHDTYLNPRRKSLLKYIQKNAPLKISDIMTAFPNESRNTIKKDLIYLRENEVIVAMGKGRGMIYTAH